MCYDTVTMCFDVCVVFQFVSTVDELMSEAWRQKCPMMSNSTAVQLPVNDETCRLTLETNVLSGVVD